MGPRILIADDTETMRQYVRAMLSGQGYELETAVDGLEAYKQIRINKPDLVLLDITMPNMDGKTALSIMREIERQRKIKETPVIMVTASRDALSRIEALSELKAHSYLVKPIKREALIKELNRLRVLGD